jgi:2-oxoglutarate dehydrogenase complex dehydrogenase (E1) component-like enzyme
MPGPSQISGLNAGYVGLVLEQYLENPEAVDPAWRELFENADDEVLAALPGLTRLVGTRPADDGNGAAPAAVAVAPPAPPPPAPPAEPAPPAPPAA